MTLRNILFQIHLWIGLGVGIFLIALGLSGSALVYPDLFGTGPATPKATASGQALPLEQIIDAARKAAPTARGNANVTLPREAGDAIGVQFVAGRGGAGEGRGGRRGEGRRGGGGARGDGGRGEVGGRGPAAPPTTVFVDPVSANVLATRTGAPQGFSRQMRQLHEAMLLGGFGRAFVSWLGVGMFFLALSGLYMWWPKKGQWKSAFFVRPTAKGARWWREFHTTFGVWFWIVFLFVTATAIPLGFSSVMAVISGGAVRQGPQGPQAPVSVEAPAGATRLPLDQIVAKVRAVTGADVASLSVPAAQDRAINVSLAGRGPGSVAVNPYTGEMLTQPQTAPAGITRRTIEVMHGGEGFGPVWKFLVFLSGFLPLIFVTSGLIMWLKKRQSRPTRT